MQTEPTVIRARMRLWALLGLLAGLWALSAPVRLFLDPQPSLPKPTLLPDPPAACSEWSRREFLWLTEAQREACAFSPLMEAPSARMVELYVPFGQLRPSGEEAVKLWGERGAPERPINRELPPGWEGITEPQDRRFLASVLPPWSSANYSRQPDKGRWENAARYE